jgi:hypothetical protein
MTWENVGFRENGVGPNWVFRILHSDELCGVYRSLSIVRIFIMKKRNGFW